MAPKVAVAPPEEATTAAASAAGATLPSKAATKAASPKWNTATDPEGNTYYWNDKGGVQYEKPEGFDAPSEQARPTAPPSQPTEGGATVPALPDATAAAGASLSSPRSLSPARSPRPNSPGLSRSETCMLQGPLSGGKVQFPTSKREAAKWSKVGDDGALKDRANEILRMMIETWRLPLPSVIISVTGGAKTLKLNDKQTLVFRRGLLNVISRTSGGGDEDKTAPWIFTGGTQSGVMELVGRAMQARDTGTATAQVPCIGVAPWGIIGQREHIEYAYKGKYKWGSLLPPSTRSETAAGGGGGIAEPLDPNHSHFLFVDNGLEGVPAFASEVPFRAALQVRVYVHTCIMRYPSTTCILMYPSAPLCRYMCTYIHA